MYKKILKVDMIQVEEKGFYIRVVCNKSEGVALSLYRALESLTNFKVQNSNLTNISDCFALTFTLNVRDGGRRRRRSSPVIRIIIYVIE
ncbi:hypothetical protein V6N13_111880 [Hibiscus sabdariffa]|uniref:Plant bHLH transcription factor ACT-like domain-containing protein n=1 Tax=Hibiscus sabdariffa TaxID=183260 RepID=A0ABR2TM23_9ROSI